MAQGVFALESLGTGAWRRPCRNQSPRLGGSLLGVTRKGGTASPPPHPTSCRSLPLAETKVEPRGVSLWGQRGQRLTEEVGFRVWGPRLAHCRARPPPHFLCLQRTTELPRVGPRPRRPPALASTEQSAGRRHMPSPGHLLRPSPSPGFVYRLTMSMPESLGAPPHPPSSAQLGPAQGVLVCSAQPTNSIVVAQRGRPSVPRHSWGV